VIFRAMKLGMWGRSCWDWYK